MNCRIFAAALFLVVLQQLAAVPSLRAETRVEQRAARGSAMRNWREPAPQGNISREPSVTSERITHAAYEPFLPSESACERFRFQRPPPVA